MRLTVLGKCRVLADRCYCSYLDIAMLKRRGIDVVFRLHQQRKCDFRCGRRLGREDQIVTWTRPGRPASIERSRMNKYLRLSRFDSSACACKHEASARGCWMW